MKRNLLKTAVMALALVLMLSAMVSCDALSNLFGGDEGDSSAPVQHTVTFELDGGVAASEDFEATAKVTKGSTVTLPEVTREGHTFLGWFVGENEFTAETPVNADTTVTAKWQVNKVTVTFLDYYDQLVDTQVIDWGTAAAAPTVEETAADMVFMGWDTDITCIKGDVTVRPIYDYKTYTVTFNVGAGATAIEPQIVRFGSKPTKPEDPDKMGNSLVGWYLDSEFTSECLFDTAFDMDTTLYAKYTNDYHTIRTAAELVAIKDNPDWKYVLLNDIDIGGVEWEPIENFSGSLDGNGKRIFNYTISDTSDYSAFINQNSGTIKNLNFDQFSMVYTHSTNATSYAAIIVAKNTGTVRDCTVMNGSISITASVTTSSNLYTAPIVGYNSGIVKDCVNNADITVNTSISASAGSWSSNHNPTFYVYASSAVGFNAGTVTEVEAYGKVAVNGTHGGVGSYASNNSCFYIGGIAGKNNTGAIISECASYAQLLPNINGSMGKTTYIGLLTGANSSQFVDNCYLAGSINVSNTGSNMGGSIGGAVGDNGTECKIDNIYADVDITVSDTVTASVGGFVGTNNAGATVTRVIYTGNITLSANVTNYGFICAVKTGDLLHCYYDSTSVLKVVEDTVNAGTCTDGTATATETLLTENFLYKTLQWDKDIWSIVDGNAPTLNALN